MTKIQAKKIVHKIINDMCGRSGGDHWFETIDEEIQKEIIREWVDIVLKGVK